MEHVKYGLDLLRQWNKIELGTQIFMEVFKQLIYICI